MLQNKYLTAEISNDWSSNYTHSPYHDLHTINSALLQLTD